MKLVKILFTFFIIAFSTKGFTGEGIVLVLEAPLLLKPSLDSPVSMFVRKGEKIFIHNKNFGASSNDIVFDDEGKVAEFDESENGTIFLQTTDSIGRDVWIEKRFVKLIYKDEREFDEKISPFEYDPKDYRIYEPIPEKYPFYQEDKRRFYVTLGLGSAHKTSYGYTENIQAENYSSRHGLNFYYLRKVDYDLMDRFYYGVNLHLYGENNDFILSNNVESTEFRGQLGIGPSITYDVYRKEFIDITFTTALTINYDRTFISQEDSLEQEERLFESFSITPKFGSLITIKKALPFAKLVLGSEVQFNYESTVNGSTQPEISKFWNSNEDYIRHPQGATFAFYFGILTTN